MTTPKVVSARMAMMLRAAAIVLIVLAVTSCGGSDCPGPDARGSVTFQGGKALTVQFADDDEERARGLMGVGSLPPDEGMAFVFEGPTEETFWMKDTLIPLSIAFVSGDTIVSIRDMQPCAADPCATYASSGAYDYAVEANQGWFARHGVREGNRVERFDEPICP